MQVTVTVTRTGSPAAVINRLTGRLLRNGLAAANECARIISEAGTALAPEDTGALKKSAYTTPAVVVGGLIQAKAGWGKQGERWIGRDRLGVIRIRHPFDYALHVHERIAPPMGGGRYDFVREAIVLRGAELRLVIRQIMNRA